MQSSWLIVSVALWQWSQHRTPSPPPAFQPTGRVMTWAAYSTDSYTHTHTAASVQRFTLSTTTHRHFTYTMFQKDALLLNFLNDSVQTSTDFNKIWHTTSRGNMLQVLIFCPPCLKTATTLSCQISKFHFSNLQQYHNVRNVNDSTSLMQSWNTQQATVWTYLLVHENMHHILSLLCHWSNTSSTTLCWKPAHVPINLCCSSAMSCNGVW